MNDHPALSRHVLLSGCSGGGKSTLLAQLARRGFAGVSEPGRRIVEEERRGAGRALPWVDPVAFAERAIEIAAQDRRDAGGNAGWTFFDRGLVDAAIALEHAAGRPAAVTLAPFARYHTRVFLTPPWPEIYGTDDERRHGLGDAIAEYDRLLTGYAQLDYEVLIIPRATVGERADFVLAEL